MEAERSRTELNLQTLYEAYLPSVYRVAFTYMHNSYDSEDAAQEAFLRLARFRGSFESERQIRAWLIVTVTNVCKDMLRRKHRQDAQLDEADAQAAGAEDGGELLEAVRRLPDQYRTVVFLHYYEGYAVEEIAAALHRPTGTVKSWLHRARQKLKESLEVNDDE